MLPPHHDPSGRFRNPWPTAYEPTRADLLRWRRERREKELAPNPRPEQLPRAESEVAYPRAAADELRATWVGHSTFLLQIGGANVLTDPHWGERASPFSWAGPKRFTPPGLPFERLPPIDAVLLSHDHYDHLDSGTVRRLARAGGGQTHWFAPLGYRRWLARHGAEKVTELDWWEEAELPVGDGVRLSARALPAQHWTSRWPWDRRRRLWASWAVRASGRSVYFGGDSGWFPGYPEIGERAGPFELLLLPVGAYDPRWFMKPAHMDPEEAVRAYRELGGEGVFAAMHWGTFRLTDEDPLEPPARLREAWAAAALPPQRLWVARHGETRRVEPGGR
jgi:N-acyl-phosphatidylethanolamine-hydrolysing phospholipase D